MYVGKFLYNIYVYIYTIPMDVVLGVSKNKKMKTTTTTGSLPTCPAKDWWTPICCHLSVAEFSPNWDDTSAKVHTQTPYLWSHFPKKMGDPSYTKQKAKFSTRTKGVTWISCTAISFHIRCIWDFQQYLSDRLKGKPMRVADWKKKNRVVMFFLTKYLLLKSYISKEPKMKKKHANEIEKWIVAIVDLLVLVLVFCFITFSGKNLGNCMFFFEISGVFPWWHRNRGEFGAAEFSHEHPIKWVTKWPKRWASQPHRFPWIFFGGVPWDPYKFATFWGEKVMWGRYDLSRYMCMYYIYIFVD